MSNIDKRALREAAEKATPGRIGDRIDGSGSIKYQCFGNDGSLVLQTDHKNMEYGFIGENSEADELFFRMCDPATVLALLDELEAETSYREGAFIACNRWHDKFRESEAKLEAAEKQITELTGKKRLIGWRMADYTDETADPALAKNWATAVDVLPIFEGDVNTKLSPASAGKGE
ncbi:MAG: ead/Ea22-like family protein [Leclercia sp.]